MLASPPPAVGAPADQYRTVNVNYVYASTLGFGGYSLAGLTASVYSLPLAHSFVLDGGGTVLRVTLPIQLGLYTFRAVDTNGAHIAISQQSLALVPGLELQVPVAGRVLLKPFVSIGPAHAFGVTDGGANALIYSGGVRSVAQWRIADSTLSVGNAVIAAGDTTIGPGFSESYVALETGVELRRPLGFTVGKVTPDLGVYAAGYYYPNALDFSRFLQPPLHVRAQGEVGLTVGSARPLEMLSLANPRIGAGYVFGGGVQVWHIVFDFPF